MLLHFVLYNVVSMKVIICNRDNYIRRDVARQLREHYPNCEVQCFEDVLLAAKSVYYIIPDVVILGMDGIKLIQMLRKQAGDMQIVILADNPDHRDEAYSLGANGYITLPLSEDALYSAVEGRMDFDMGEI